MEYRVKVPEDVKVLDVPLELCSEFESCGWEVIGRPTIRDRFSAHRVPDGAEIICSDAD